MPGLIRGVLGGAAGGFALVWFADIVAVLM